MKCPPEETIAEFAQGAAVGDTSALEQHLDACADCRRRLALAAAAAPSGPEPAAEEFRMRRGDRLGRYVLVEPLGRGGMARVVLCYDPELDRRVALKVLDSRTGAATREQMLEEARHAARLVHPNVVVVHDVGTAGGVSFIAMELAEGGTFYRWQQSRPPAREVLARYRAAGEGLAAAHRAGLVHRDFKPANVLLGTDGRPRVADFGLAQPAGTVPAKGGTPGYMAPEQHRGQADPRSDQFSFCVALWEALSGVRPDPAGPREGWGRLPAEVPLRVQRALERGLALDPAQRFPSMEPLLAELSPDRLTPAQRRGLSAVAAVALLAGGALAWTLVDRRDPCAAEPPAWEPGQLSRAQASFSSSGLGWQASAWTDFEAQLARWGREWAAARREACLAGSIGAPARECLARGERQAGALLSLAERADATLVARAGAAVRALPDPAGCSPRELVEAESRTPLKPGAAPVVAEVQDRFARIQALLDAGAVTRSRTLAEETLGLARTSADPGLVARALFLAGSAQALLGLPEAETTLAEALDVADASGMDRLRARAALALARRSGCGPSRGSAEPWLHVASAALRRVGAPPELSAELEEVRGGLRHLGNDFPGAERHLAQAEALLAPLGERALSAQARVGAWRSAALALCGRGTEAEAVARRTLGRSPVLTPGHPDRLLALAVLAFVRERRGDAAEAADFVRQLASEHGDASAPTEASLEALLDDRMGGCAHE